MKKLLILLAIAAPALLAQQYQYVPGTDPPMPGTLPTVPVKIKVNVTRLYIMDYSSPAIPALNFDSAWHFKPAEPGVPSDASLMCVKPLCPAH